MTATLTLQGDPYFSGDLVPQIYLSESALSRFTGNYHSDELETTYELSLVKGVLTLKNGNQTPVNLHPVAKRISGRRPRNDRLPRYCPPSRPRTDPFLTTGTRHCFRQSALSCGNVERVAWTSARKSFLRTTRKSRPGKVWVVSVERIDPRRRRGHEDALSAPITRRLATSRG